MLLGDAHPQCFGMLSICQLYLNAMLSQNSCLFKTYPNQDRGQVVSQLDTPFCWAFSNARWLLMFTFINTS